MRDELTSGRDAATWSPLDSDGWYAARNATTALRDALVRAGLEKDFPYLRADLNAFGHGLVELGRVAPTRPNASQNFSAWRWRAALAWITAASGTHRPPPVNAKEGPDGMTDRRGVVAKRAEDLLPGAPYVRGWNRARRSAGILADQLVLLGLDSDFPGLAADVNVFGDGLVQLGTVRPEAAELLAKLIKAGLEAELRGTVVGSPMTTRHGAPAA